MCAVRVLVAPRLGLLPRAAPTALDHVAKEGPRAGAEADEGDLALEAVARLGDGGVDVLELVEDVDVAVEEAALGVLRVAERVGEVRAEAGEHLDVEAHGLRDDEDVGEDDRGVEESVEAADGLEGDLACEVRGAAHGEERVLCADVLELWEVPPRLAHDPDWGRGAQGEGLGALGGAQEGVVAEGRERVERGERVVGDGGRVVDLARSALRHGGRVGGRLWARVRGGEDEEAEEARGMATCPSFTRPYLERLCQE